MLGMKIDSWLKALQLALMLTMCSTMSGPAVAESSHDIVVGIAAEAIMANGTVLAQSSVRDKEGRVKWSLLVAFEGRVWDCAWFWDGPGVTSIVQGCYRAKK